MSICGVLKIMTDEDEFIIQHWGFLKEEQKKGEKLDGVLCLGDYSSLESHKEEPIKILNNLVNRGYFKRVPSPNSDKTHCFKFTESGEKHVNYLMSGVGKV